ncbi:MAG: ATP-binding cassette domain-containing protein, partial [Gammaproteobacteria bacterium]
MTANVALDVSGVSKTFISGGLNVKALDNVTIQIQQGKVTGLIGPDAAGKTTLMRLVAGLLLPDEGHIEALGIDVLQQPLQV